MRSTCALRGIRRIEHALHVRPGDGQQLNGIRELVHHAEADVEARQTGVGVEIFSVLRGEPLAGPLVPLLELARRQDVAENVDEHEPHSTASMRAP